MTRWLVIPMIGEQNIPKDWPLVDFEEAVDILDSRREPINSEEREKRTSGVDQSDLYPYYGAGGQIGWIDDYIFDDELILLAEDGATTGYVYMVSGKSWINNHAHVLRENPEVVKKMFLYYYLKSYNFDHLKTGGTRPKLTQTNMKKLKIPTPPLDEQERIVEEIEERLERVRRLEKSVESVGRYAKEYRESLIEYLFVGRRDLSTQSPEQIPTEKDIPEDWDIKTIGEISSQIRTGGTPKKSRDEFWGGSIPWKASKHFNEESLQLDESSEYVTEKGKSESTIANPDDVVIVCRGAHTGKVGLAKSRFLFNQDVKVIRLPEEINSEFVAHYLSNHTEYFLQKQRGGTTKGITTSHVKNLKIPTPPEEKQKEIVEKIKSIDFTKVSKAVSDVSTHFDEYRNSVLAHAFNGQIDY